MQQMNAIVTARIEVAAGLIILRVAPDGWDLPEWRAGQFAVLGLPSTAPRTRMSDPDPVEHDLGMSLEQERKGSADGGDVHRLPKPVQHQHVLVKIRRHKQRRRADLITIRQFRSTV